MIFCKELNKHFNTKEEMLADMVTNKELIMDAKKSAIKFSDAINLTPRSLDAEKAEQTEAPKYELGDIIYPVINTTNYLDSHADVHAREIWNKSAQDQNGKIYYLQNHDFEIGDIIATPKDVTIELREMTWKELGKDYKGKTTALVYGVKLTDLAPDQFLKLLRSGHPLENSVRMSYVSMSFCVNNSEFVDEYANWNKYIKEVANREDAEELGYFWYIKEAKIVKEGSAVLNGSNDVTPILPKQEQKEEPTDVTLDTNNSKVAKKAPVWLY